MTRRTWFRAQAELEFAIPIFDTGKARMRKAELAYMRAANLLAEKAVNVRSETRSAYEAYRSHLRHRAALPQQRRAAADEDRGGITAHLQRHDHQHLRTAGRYPRQDQLPTMLIPQRQARFLAGRSQPRRPPIYGGGAGGGSGETEVASASRRRRARH